MALPILAGDTVNVRLCIGSAATTATVVSVDYIRRTTVVQHLQAPLASQPPSTISLDCCRKTTDPYQFAVAVGPVWDL